MLAAARNRHNLLSNQALLSESSAMRSSQRTEQRLGGTNRPLGNHWSGSRFAWRYGQKHEAAGREQTTPPSRGKQLASERPFRELVDGGFMADNQDTGLPRLADLMGPVVLETIIEAQRPALAAMGELNSRLYDGIAAMSKEWVSLFNLRLREDLAIPEQLAACKNTRDM